MKSPLSVAILDDDDDVRLSLGLLISSSGVDCRPFASPFSLLESTDLADFDCIISDIQMPGMDGLSLTRELRRRTNAIIVLFSAHTTDALIKRAFAAGADYFIAKPIQPDALFGIIESVGR